MSKDENTKPEQVDADGRRDTVPAQTWSDDDREKERGPMGPISGDPGGRLDEEALAEGSDDGGLTEASRPGQGPTDDDLTPETLIREDGARSPFEAGSGGAADRQLGVVGAGDIGAGGGLDEAEEGRAHPLDGKPWDGDPEDPLRPLPGVQDDLDAEDPADIAERSEGRSRKD